MISSLMAGENQKASNAGGTAKKHLYSRREFQTASRHVSRKSGEFRYHKLEIWGSYLKHCVSTFTLYNPYNKFTLYRLLKH